MSPQIESLFNALSDGLLLVSREGVVIFSNQAARDLPGWPVGAALPDIELQTAVTNANQGRLALPYELTIGIANRHDGRNGRSPSSIRCRLMESPVALSYILVLHDTSLADRNANLLGNLSQMLSRFPREIYEQFLLVLNATLAESRSAGYGISEFERLAAETVRRGELLCGQLQQVFGWAQLENGEAIVGEDIISMTDLIESELPGLQKLGATRNIRVRLDKQVDKPPLICGSRSWLRRALHECVVFAIFNANKSALITIATRQNASSVQVTLDTPGLVISPHLLRLLFQPGYQSDGTGQSTLGLPLCKLIVESHGGALGVDDQKNGGRFFLQLPISPSKGPRAATDSQQAFLLANDLAHLLAQQRNLARHNPDRSRARRFTSGKDAT